MAFLTLQGTILFLLRHHLSIIFMVCSCHYWQWPVLINCVMYNYLCVLRWLMTPMLALNCLLQIEQERSAEENSVGDALALAFHSACFRSALLILFASYSFLRGLATLFDPVQSVSRLCWYVEVFKGGFECVLVSLLLATMRSFSNL